jgi:hypothetical protein
VRSELIEKENVAGSCFAVGGISTFVTWAAFSMTV